MFMANVQLAAAAADQRGRDNERLERADDEPSRLGILHVNECAQRRSRAHCISPPFLHREHNDSTSQNVTSICSTCLCVLTDLATFGDLHRERLPIARHLIKVSAEAPEW